MSLSYKEIRNERQWKASTGLGKEQFFVLLELFSQCYEDIFDESMESRQSNTSSNSTFKTYADLLFFGLFSIKSGLTYDLLALSFGLDKANVYKNQSLVLRVLEATLEQSDLMPMRSFQSEEAFKSYLGQEPSVLIDVTEQRRQRPGDQQEQKEDYSGKKKHTP